MTVNLTDLEKQTLEAILHNDFYDGVKGEGRINCALWSNCISHCGKMPMPTGKALSGVISSLCKKGILGNTDEGRDSITWLTGVGYNVCVELKFEGL